MITAEIPRCPRCFSNFDSEKHQPKILFCCGTNYCERCLFDASKVHSFIYWFSNFLSHHQVFNYRFFQCQCLKIYDGPEFLQGLWTNEPLRELLDSNVKQPNLRPKSPNFPRSKSPIYTRTKSPCPQMRTPYVNPSPIPCSGFTQHSQPRYDSSSLIGQNFK